MLLETERLLPVGDPRLRQEDGYERFLVRLILADKIDLTAPGQDKVFAKVLTGNRIRQPHAKYAYGPMLQWFKP